MHIPKENGKTRPIGVSTIEDKVVQNALREVLEVVYEPMFHEGSYGFRPRRSAHDALRVFNRMLHERIRPAKSGLELRGQSCPVLRQNRVDLVSRRRIEARQYVG